MPDQVLFLFGLLDKNVLLRIVYAKMQHERNRRGLTTKTEREKAAGCHVFIPVTEVFKLDVLGGERLFSYAYCQRQSISDTCVFPDTNV